MTEEQVRVLFLSANPKQSQPLDLLTECTEIEQALYGTQLKDRFVFHQRSQLGRDQLLDHLLLYKPHIVHFSGHGTEQSLLLQDRQGNTWPLDVEAARVAFAQVSSVTRLVVLNACYSSLIAESLSEAIGCVIGMAQPIYDHSAIAFSSALYRALGNGKSVREALDIAKAQLTVKGLPGSRLPQILFQPGLDPRRMFPLEWIGGMSAKSGLLPGMGAQGQGLSVPSDRATLRRALNDRLRLDADFDAFVLDAFPDVHRRYASGMERTQKVNLLLTLKDVPEIASALSTVGTS